MTGCPPTLTGDRSCAARAAPEHGVEVREIADEQDGLADVPIYVGEAEDGLADVPVYVAEAEDGLA